MSSVGLSGLSNISSDTLQIRYQKALKQINKLIQINRQLKQASNEKDKQIVVLSTQIAQLQRNVRDLDDQNNILDSKYMELDRNCQQLENYCKQLEQKIHENVHDKDLEEKLRQHEIKFHQQLQNEALKYNQLARQAEILHHVYQESLTSIQTHEAREKTLVQESLQLKAKVAKLEQENCRISQNLKENNNQQLRKKLQQANFTIQKLLKECSQLRNRQIDFEVFQQKQKFEQSLGLSLIHDPRQNDAVKLLIEEYRKKIISLQSSKKQFQVKYKHLKQKYNNIVSQNNLTKIQRLQKLTQKQQMQIARLIQTYDREINFLFKENKKLKQGVYSLSYRFKQKSMELESKQKLLSQLKISTQRVSFENQSLKKLNHSLVSAKTNHFSRDFCQMKKDFSHSQSLTMFDKRQSNQKINEANKNVNGYTEEAYNTGFFNAEQKVRAKSKLSENSVSGGQVGSQMRYMKPPQSNFRFIQSVNIINGYNVNLSENPHLKK